LKSIIPKGNEVFFSEEYCIEAGKEYKLLLDVSYMNNEVKIH